MTAALLSPPLSDEERVPLRELGRRLRCAREAAGMSRRVLADRTGLNPRTIARIEAGERRTRERTLGVLVVAISAEPAALVQELVAVGGPAIAAESPYAERVERRRLRRVRRLAILEERERYAAERAALEARWVERRAAHLRFRASMRLIDASMRALQRLGYW